jgi:hypothetical protein
MRNAFIELAQECAVFEELAQEWAYFDDACSIQRNLIGEVRGLHRDLASHRHAMACFRWEPDRAMRWDYPRARFCVDDHHSLRCMKELTPLMRMGVEDEAIGIARAQRSDGRLVTISPFDGLFVTYFRHYLAV